MRILCFVGWHRFVRGVTGYVDRCERCGNRRYRDTYNDYGYGP